MKLVHYDLFPPFEIDDDRINAVVLENGSLLYKFSEELCRQAEGADGNIVLSRDNKIISLSKNAEILTNFISFELNSKRLITKLFSRLEKVCGDDLFSETLGLKSTVSEYLLKAADNFSSEIVFDTELDIKALFKAVGVRFNDEYETLSEKVTEYMLNFIEMEGERLFILINFHDFVSDEEFGLFMDTILAHKINLLLIENHDIATDPRINKIIIDKDYCVI